MPSLEAIHQSSLHTSDGDGLGLLIFFGTAAPLAAPALLSGRVGFTSPGSNTSSGRLMLLSLDSAHRSTMLRYSLPYVLDAQEVQLILILVPVEAEVFELIDLEGEIERFGT